MSEGATASVAVLGSINMDSVFQVRRLPHPGETILSLAKTQHLGGKGANQAVAAARAGVRVRLIGAASLSVGRPGASSSIPFAAELLAAS